MKWGFISVNATSRNNKNNDFCQYCLTDSEGILFWFIYCPQYQYCPILSTLFDTKFVGQVNNFSMHWLKSLSVLSRVYLEIRITSSIFWNPKYTSAVYVCLYSFTVKTSSVYNEVWDILEGTDQRFCVVSIILGASSKMSYFTSKDEIPAAVKLERKRYDIWQPVKRYILI